MTPRSRPPMQLAQFLRREPCLNGSSLLIGLGLVMLMQPWSMTLFSYSFAFILVGTLAFTISGHLPE